MINLAPYLLAQKDKELLYYKTIDPFHWNKNGAFIGYAVMMNRIKNDFPSLKVLTKDDFNITATPKNGAIMYNQKELSKYKIANMVFDFKDVEYDYKLKKESEQVLRYQPDILPKNAMAWSINNKNLKDGKTILIIGDSYMHTLFPWLKESFKNIFFVRFWDILFDAQKMNNTINKTKPDIVLIEIFRESPTRAINFFSVHHNIEQEYKFFNIREFDYANRKISAQ